MKGRVDVGTTPHEMSQAARQWAQPWWLHASVANDRDGHRSTRDVRREFARMATQIGLAAWMFGTAMTSSCVSVNRWSGATPVAQREASVTAGAQASAPAARTGRPG